jgi:hypothetical protein
MARDRIPNKQNRSDNSQGKKGTLPARPGLPAESSILSETILVSPKRTYWVFKTSERDAYDESASPQEKKRP